MQKLSPTSEWTTVPITLEGFVFSPAWEALSFGIKVALARLWLSEQPSGSPASRVLWTTDAITAKKITPPAEAEQPLSTVSPSLDL